MSRLRRLAKSFRYEEPFTNLTAPTSRIGGLSLTGVNMTADRALRHAAVWACVRARSEDIAKLPVKVVEQDGPRRIVKEQPTWLSKPNPETTTFELFERTVASIDIEGNAFWYTERDRLGRCHAVWPLNPSSVDVFREQAQPGDTGVRPKRFRYANEEYGADEIVHFTGFSLPGRLRGLNPIQMQMASIGLSIAAESFGESFFSNGATMSGMVEMPGVPDAEQVAAMREGIARDHTGLANAHKPGILTGGAKWTPLSMPNDAAQFLETRNYQLSDIARIFRMPNHKINDLTHATFSNIEHISIEYVVDGLVPTTTRIESTVGSANLLEPREALKFNVNALMRGDTAARFAAYAQGRQWGWLNVDDIRYLEDMNPLPDGAGTEYLRPLNMAAVGADAPEMTPLEVAGLIQKIYLGVGVVISADEARAILTSAGVSLSGSLSTMEASSAP